MASAMIHIAVANEINKSLHRDNRKILLGSIAPDISKLIGESKVKSHFSNKNSCIIPDINRFLNKYKEYLNDDFVLGYYIHLYTDYLWFKYFMTEITDKNVITKMNGEKIHCNGSMITMYIYNDYTNLNMQLIDKYELDLKIFYEDLPALDNIIKEIPMEQLNVVVDKMGIIIANSKEHKEFVFDINNIVNFITISTQIILTDIHDLHITNM